MISRFGVWNFKSLKDLNIDLRQFMVLVGPNGAGKTNLIRAMEVFGEIIRRGTVEPIQEHGYDQLIRREKRPARSGLRFEIEVELPAKMVAQSVSRISRIINTASEQAPKEPPVVEGEVFVGAGIGVVGSIFSDELAVIYESFTLRSSKGTLQIARNGGETTVDAGRDPALWRLMADELFSTVRMPSLSSFLRGEGLDSQAGMKRVLLEAFGSSSREQDVDARLLRLVNWQRRPSIIMHYLRDACRVYSLRLDASVLRRDSSYEEGREVLGPTGEGLAAAVAKLRGSRGSKAVSAQFRKVLEDLQEVYPRVEDVLPHRTASGRLMLLFKERGISEHLGQGSTSDGVLHALAFLVALHQSELSGRIGLLAIEEPENAIHPWPLRRLIGHAQEGGRQIILTTHSETVVNAVKNPEDLYVAENDDRSGTIIERAVEREAALKSILEESGQKLGDVWIGGTLGGVPGGGL